MQLEWLPEPPDWAASLIDLRRSKSVWEDAAALSRHRLTATQTNALDRLVRELVTEPPPRSLAGPSVRLAILGSSTMAHLHSGIRMGGMRRNLSITIHEAAYGQYRQALADPAELKAFQPTAILFALDAYHLAAGVEPSMSLAETDAALEAAAERIRQCWRLAKTFDAAIIQTIPLPVHAGLAGNNEHRLVGSPRTFISRLSDRLRRMADDEQVDVLSLDVRATADGLTAWHDPDLWHQAKMEVAPSIAPTYGDCLARLLAAQVGVSRKCLVLDLDNTLWGGAVGDLGIDGIELGQGSATGEAFTAVQAYSRALSQRGVILAVCSKNDEHNAVDAFDRHPEMVLRRSDITCFVANWNDKASNLRRIAKELNIGLDALVFLDDNPFERELVRRELPMVAVPEISDDPSTYPRLLEKAGYFETTHITEDDLRRGEQYRQSAERTRLSETATDLESYLSSLNSRLTWRSFDRLGLSRIVQLANKTNQFNLTTRRYSEADIISIMEDQRSFGLQLRLADRFGDNGTIAAVIGRLQPSGEIFIESWLMSCRVLGRGVETATLQLVVDQARRLGAARIIGEYRPTAKNGMVRDLYARLGFNLDATADEKVGDAQRYSLELAQFHPAEVSMSVEEEVIFE
jgi:FkbH-like protein